MGRKDELIFWDPYAHDEVVEKPIELLPPGKHEDVKHGLTFKEKMEMIASYASVRAKLWYRFRVSFFISLLSMVIAILIWFFMGVVLGNIDLGSGYQNVNYFTFVLVGIIINQYITLTLTTYLDTLREIYWDNRLELYMTSPARLNTFFVSALLWTYLYATINVLIYFSVGIFVFGANLSLPSAAHAFGMILILLLLIVALSGIGLISASMFFFLEAKGSEEPISWFLVTITGLVAGVFYPAEIFLTHFPPLYYLSQALPQTHAIGAIRKIMMIGGPGLPLTELLRTIIILAVFALILFPLGQAMFKKAVRKGEKEGKLAKWS